MIPIKKFTYYVQWLLTLSFTLSLNTYQCSISVAVQIVLSDNSAMITASYIVLVLLLYLHRDAH